MSRYRYYNDFKPSFKDELYIQHCVTAVEKNDYRLFKIYYNKIVNKNVWFGVISALKAIDTIREKKIVGTFGKFVLRYDDDDIMRGYAKNEEVEKDKKYFEIIDDNDTKEKTVVNPPKQRIREARAF